MILYSIFALILLILTVVSFHEYGHFFFARFFGVRVEIFSIGFGKVLFSRVDKHGTEWRISLFPLGGYVKMYGDNKIDHVNGEIENKDEAFESKALWKRAIIVAAGPIANYILAFFIFVIVLYSFGMTKINKEMVILDVKSGSYAEEVGILAGDIITDISIIDPIKNKIDNIMNNDYDDRNHSCRNYCNSPVHSKNFSCIQI